MTCKPEKCPACGKRGLVPTYLKETWTRFGTPILPTQPLMPYAWCRKCNTSVKDEEVKLVEAEQVARKAATEEAELARITARVQKTVETADWGQVLVECVQLDDWWFAKACEPKDSLDDEPWTSGGETEEEATEAVVKRLVSSLQDRYDCCC